MSRILISALLTAFLAGCPEGKEVEDSSTGDLTLDQVTVDQVTVDQIVDGPVVDMSVDAAAPDQSMDSTADMLADLSPDTDPAPDLSVADLYIGPLTSSSTSTWYQGGTTCTPKSITATGGAGQITVDLLQVPFNELTGTCAGHKSKVTQTGSIIDITFTKVGTACYTACWDFKVVITGVAPGTYTLKAFSLSTTATVS